MSLADELRANYSVQTDEVEKKIGQILYYLVNGLKAISRKQRSIDALYSPGADECSFIEECFSMNKNYSTEYFYHYEDFGPYRDGILKHTPDLEGKYSNNKRVFHKDEIAQISAGVERSLKESGITNCSIKEVCIGTHALTYQTKSPGAFQKEIKGMLYGKTKAEKTKVLTVEIPRYALHIRASW